MAKILIVDDSKTSRKFLRNMLEKAGQIRRRQIQLTGKFR